MWGTVLKSALSAVLVLLYTRMVFKIGVSYAMRRIMDQSSEDIQKLVEILFEREGRDEDDNGEREG